MEPWGVYPLGALAPQASVSPSAHESPEGCHGVLGRLEEATGKTPDFGDTQTLSVYYSSSSEATGL
jgi:hypothetical protein